MLGAGLDDGIAKSATALKIARNAATGTSMNAVVRKVCFKSGASSGFI